MGISKKKMGGFLVSTLLLSSLIVALLLIIYKANPQEVKYNSKAKLISYIDNNTNFEFRIQKFYGFMNKMKAEGKLDSFFNEKMKETIKEEGFLNYKVKKLEKEIVLVFKKDENFNYNVIFSYNIKNQLKLRIKNIQETRKNEN